MAPHSAAVCYQIFGGRVSDNRYRLVCRPEFCGGDFAFLGALVTSVHCFLLFYDMKLKLRL
jgi:hypothetical protein